MFVKEAEKMVAEFMEVFGQRRYSSPDKTPCDVSALRSRLISEESKEYHAAPVRGVAELDGLCDLLYVVLGTNLALGIPADEITTTAVFSPKMTKIHFWSDVMTVVQDLDSRFPCEKIQRAGLRILAQRCLDIAAMRGYEFEGAFREVHRSNMGKLWTDDTRGRFDYGLFTQVFHKGKRCFIVQDKNGKIIKPLTFAPPDLSPYIR